MSEGEKKKRKKYGRSSSAGPLERGAGGNRDSGKPPSEAPSLHQCLCHPSSPPAPFLQVYSCPTTLVYKYTEPGEKEPLPLLPRDTMGPTRIPHLSYNVWRLPCFLFNMFPLILARHLWTGCLGTMTPHWTDSSRERVNQAQWSAQSQRSSKKSDSSSSAPPFLRLPPKTWDPLKGVVDTTECLYFKEADSPYPPSILKTGTILIP